MNSIQKYIISLGIVMSILYGCDNTNSSKTTIASQEGNTHVTTNEAGQDYRMVFVDGTYKVSNTRGATTALALTSNITAFETGLMDLSKKQFPTNQYYFVEGQFISSEDINRWMTPQSDENPDGLNNIQGDNKPIVVTILEQDYTVFSNANYALAGVSIGIALNPDINQQTTLTDAQLIEEGKAAATKIVERLRKKEGFTGLPILVGLFKQSNDKGVSRGVYLASAVTSKDIISNWQPTYLEKRIFPLDIDKTTEATTFSNFKKSVETFFPNLNGVVAEATFSEDVMTKIDITITTQFYGQAEMIALSQFLLEQSQMYNTPELVVTMKVESVRGTELTVFKKVGDSTFHSIILK